MWNVLATEEFGEWFAALGEDAKVEVIAKVELLKLFGPKLSRPHADTLKDARYANMKELRASTKTQVLRIIFAFDPDRSAILLTAGNKTGVSEKYFYRQLIAKAEALYEIHLAKRKAHKPEKKD